MRRRWWQRSAQPSPGAVPAGQPAPEAVPPSLLAWAQAVDVSRLSDKTVRQVERFLRGYRHMTLADRKDCREHSYGGFGGGHPPSSRILLTS